MFLETMNIKSWKFAIDYTLNHIEKLDKAEKNYFVLFVWQLVAQHDLTYNCKTTA